jgi:rhodanese-related sulfurtransferase
MHPSGALSVPLADLASGAPTVLPDDKEAPIVTVCKVGERSLHGMLLLKALGYRDVKSVRGGLDAWLAAGLPADES